MTARAEPRSRTRTGALLESLRGRKRRALHDSRSSLDRFPRPALAIRALYASNRYLAAKTRAFLDFLAGRFGEEREWDRFRRGRA